MEINRVLFLSTAHLPFSIKQRIDDGEMVPNPLMVGDFGSMFNTSQATEDSARSMDESDYALFANLLNFGRAHKCTHIVFDRDADTIPYLPQFDW